MKRSNWWRRLKRSLKQPPKTEVDRYFEAFRAQEYPQASAKIRAWLERAEEAQAVDRQAMHKTIRQIMTYTHTYRAKLAFGSLVMALFFAACTLPVEHEETLGYMLTGQLLIDPVEGVTSLEHLSWITPSQLSTTVAVQEIMGRAIISTVRFAIVLPGVNTSDATHRKAELEALAGVRAVTMTSLEGRIKQPAYKVLWPSHWQGEDISSKFGEAFVEGVVQEHLDRLNMHGIEVEHVTRQGGERILKLASPSSGNGLEKKAGIGSTD